MESTVEILLVEDNPADARLAQTILSESRVPNRVSVVADGSKAMDFLYRRNEYESAPEPDLILLDLNLPGKNGHQILKEIRADSNFRNVPILVLTTSAAREDMTRTFSLDANSFITKPVDLDTFINVMKVIEEYWFKIVRQRQHAQQEQDLPKLHPMA